MSWQNVRPDSDYLRAALVIGAISIAGAAWQGILDSFVSFLFLISCLFVPVFAIMVVDYWILRRGRYDVPGLVAHREEPYWYRRGVNPVAVVAFLVGAALAFYWIRISPLPVGATIPVFVVTFVLYLVVSLAVRSRDGAAGRRPDSASGTATARTRR